MLHARETEIYGCKLDATMSFRLPKHTKDEFMRLSIDQRHRAEHELRVVIARALHYAKFKIEHYL